MERVNYEYEEDLDILYIYNNLIRGKKVTNTLVFGNIVIDVGEDGKVLGIEIDCASRFFNFPPEQLKNLKMAKIQAIKIDNILTLGVAIATPIREHSFQFILPQEINKAPIISY